MDPTNDTTPTVPPQALPTAQLAASPTGLPMLPPKAVPWVGAALACLAAIVPFVPSHTLYAQFAPLGISLLGGLLGIASPGLRRAVQ
jgi:hypothetical protein